MSISVDAEDGNNARSHNLLNASATGGIGAGGTIASAAAPSGPFSVAAERAWSPDFSANIRVDQAWGSAQLSGALHNASAGYYATGAGAPATANGHPDDAWGWAVQAGLRLNNFLMPKDTIEGAIAYSKGATGYVLGSPNNYMFGSGNSVATGWLPMVCSPPAAASS